MASPAPPPAPRPKRTLAAPGLGVLASRGLRAPGADLQGADLSGQDLSFADLLGADLRGADLSAATLHGARLRGARLDGANLEGAWGEDLDLEGASLVEARLKGARLPDANLLEARLRGADLRGCSMLRADLREAGLSQANLEGADLSRADLSGAELAGIEATGARWTKARIRGARGLSEATRAELLSAGAWEGIGSPELAPTLALAGRMGRPLARAATGLAGRARSGARTWWTDQAQARRAAAMAKAEARASAARSRLAEHQEHARSAETFASAAAQVRARREEAAAQARAELAALSTRPQGEAPARADRVSVAELEPWRTARAVDLAGRNLAGHDLRDLQWEEAVLEGCSLDGARLDRTVLRRARLARADLSQASLVGSDLRGASASQARLIDADLRGADLRDMDLTGAVLAGADLRGARLAGANLTGASLERAVLSDLDLRTACLDEASLSQADLTGARLEGSSARGARIGAALGLTPAQRFALVDAGAIDQAEEEAPETVLALVQAQLRPLTRRLRAVRLEPATEAQLLWLELRARLASARARRSPSPEASEPLPSPDAPAPSPALPPSASTTAVGGPGADLSGAMLRGRRLDEASWRGAILTGAQLSGASLRGADLREASGELLDLTGATLSGARCACLKAPRSQLVDADLRRVDLGGADLFQADLSGADLRGASLRGLDLREANLTGARLSDLDLSEVRLDGATLNQADLAGCFLAEASWTGADIRGVLGIDAEQRSLLLDLGAIESSALPEPKVLLGLGLDLARRLGGAIQRGAASGRRSVGQRALDESLGSPTEGAGPDLSGQDLSGRHLGGVTWRGALLSRARLEGAQLERADLREAQAEEALFSRARLLEADLAGLQAPRARFVDADLRRSDLRNASLASADLTGADLRGALLHGLDLSGANLTASRLSDLDLSGVRLDGAILDQADLAGTELVGASLDGADLRGALGLSGPQREQLAAAGARVTDASLRELVQGLRPRQLAAAVAIIALGLGSYGAARLIGPTSSTGAAESAAELRGLPPAEAMARFEELAQDANLPQERVGWLLEAAGQARLLADVEGEERLLRQALSEAGEDGAAGAEARMNLATLLAGTDQGVEALAMVEPLLDLVQQPPEQRAKAVLLFQELARANGQDPEERIERLLDSLTALPDASAELLMALASAHSTGGDTAQALAALDRAGAAQLSESTRARLYEARARVYDRAGDLDAAAEAYRQMAAQVMAGTAAQQVALLALADVLARKGERAEAEALLAELLAEGTDDRVRIRAHIALARAQEDAGQLSEAARSWQSAIQLASVDPEMADEARLSLARLVGARADDPSLAEFFATMDPDAKAMVELQTRLGKARELLEAGAGAEAIPLLEAMLAGEGPGGQALDAATRRDASLSLGEALAQEGEMGKALAIWRDLLSESASGDDRVHLQLRMADGLLDSGRLEDAERILNDLVGSSDADVAVQGRLGLGRLALARGERERARQAFSEVARLSTDPAWAVRALEELASLAEEGADEQAAIDAWRAVVEAAPPGHPAAARARMATVNRLSAAGRLAEAATACREAIRAATSPGERARALLTCAEVDERAGDTAAALSRYEAASAMAVDGQAELLLDSTSGLARTAQALGRPELALEASARALGVASEAAVRIELLDLRIEALDALGRDSQEARQAREALLAQVPGAAAAAFLARAHEARGSGDLAQAVDLLKRARDAAIDPEVSAGILLELGDAHLEAGEVEAALSAWRQAVQATPEDETVAFQAGMGEASAALVGGEPARAAALLEALRPPDEDSRRQLLEARATALARAGDEGAVAAWQEAAASAGDAEARSSALKGQADALFGLDRFAEALVLYDQAVAAAPDPTSRGWAQLGAAEARLALALPDAALALDPLRSHPDPEVALQAAIRRSQVAASAEQWALALEVLPPTLSSTMGPAWDVALTLTRAAALEGTADLAGAEAELQALATRWPQDEEAIVQALLSRARLARTMADEARATALAEQAGERARDPALAAQVRDFLAEPRPD